MSYIGIDVHKDTCTATILTNTGRLKAQFDFPNRPHGFEQLEKKLRPRDHLVVEAGTYVYPLHDHFREHGYEVIVGHPQAIRLITESDKKTDKHDSEKLANLGRLGAVPRAYMPHPQLLRNRELVRARADLANQSTTVKTKIRSFLAKQGLEPPSNLFENHGRKWLRKPHWNDSRDIVLANLVQELDDLEARRAPLDEALARLAIDDEDVKILMSIPGIDYYLALVIVSEIGDVTRFDSAEAFRSYAGCAPRMRESAGKNKGRGTMRGSSRLKSAITLAAQTASRYDNPIGDAFRKRLKKTGKSARAHAVARRKMCDLVRILLLKRELCAWAPEASIERKLVKLERFKDRDREPPTPP